MHGHNGLTCIGQCHDSIFDESLCFSMLYWQCLLKIRCRTPISYVRTYDIVRARYRTSGRVCRYYTSDLRHRRLARIQMSMSTFCATTSVGAFSIELDNESLSFSLGRWFTHKSASMHEVVSRSLSDQASLRSKCSPFDHGTVLKAFEHELRVRASWICRESEKGGSGPMWKGVVVHVQDGRSWRDCEEAEVVRENEKKMLRSESEKIVPESHLLLWQFTSVAQKYLFPNCPQSSFLQQTHQNYLRKCGRSEWLD